MDWLVEVAEEYHLVPDSLYLSVAYIDRFLSQVLVVRSKLQLVGVTCMLLAFKYEEIYGTLLIKKDCLVYEPFSHKADLKGEYDLLASNEKLMESATDENQLNLKLQDYTAKIDFLDIIECNKLPLVNEKAVMSESHEVKDAYKYNIFLQLVQI